jgi:hypothetical protein
MGSEMAHLTPMASQHLADTALNDIIIFDEIQDELEEDSAQIGLRYRQPSFTFLGKNPVPKGFQSLSDFLFHRRGSDSRSYQATGAIGECPVVADVAPLPFLQGNATL